MWISVLLSTVNGTELGAKEWRDSFFLRYGIDPPDLPPHCDGCGASFLICHTLDCKNGGLITDRHNELRDEVANLTGKAFTPAHVHDDPTFFIGRAVRGGEGQRQRKRQGVSFAGRGGGEGVPLDSGLMDTGYG